MWKGKDREWVSGSRVYRNYTPHSIAYALFYGGGDKLGSQQVMGR